MPPCPGLSCQQLASYRLSAPAYAQQAAAKESIFFLILQRPEVRLHISKGRTTHVLEACLTPEGGRTYKIDGKLKTGTQVKVSCSCMHAPARTPSHVPAWRDAGLLSMA